jgi:hypothetical protein
MFPTVRRDRPLLSLRRSARKPDCHNVVIRSDWGSYLMARPDPVTTLCLFRLVKVEVGDGEEWA